MAFVNLEPYLTHLESGHILLTPGLRLARQITSAWVAQQSSREPEVYLAPAVMPVDSWLEGEWRRRVELGHLPPARLLNRLEERLLWQSVVEQDPGFDHEFRLLQPAAAADRAMASRQALLQYAERPEAVLGHSAWDQDPDCAAFRRWLRAFESTLKNNHWLTRADAYHQLLTLSPGDRPAAVLCFGLNVSPLQQRVLEHLADLLREGDPDMTAPPVLPGRRFLDRRAELASAAQWAAERYRKGLGSTAIALLDMERDRPELEYFLREAFDCLDARYENLPVNFSAGIPLANTPMYRDAVLVQRLGMEPLSRQQCLALLRSPYVMPEGFAESHQGLALSKSITDLATETIDVADLRHLATCHAPDSVFAAMVAAPAPGQRSGIAANEYYESNTSHHLRQPLSDWVESFRAKLALCRWPARPGLDSLEYQQVEKLEVAFDDLLRLSELVGEVSFARALSLWQSVLAERVFQPKTEQHAVQVLGPMEVVGLSFDALWICGAQSGVLPRNPQLLPFIPGVLQRMLGLPFATPEGVVAQAARQLNSWMANQRQVIASCHKVADGVEQIPSRFIELQEDDLPRPQSHARWRMPGAIETVDDSIVPTPGDLVQFGGGSSVLKNQACCPFRAWITHRLGPQSITEEAFGLSAMERGSLVHEALDQLWRGLGSQQQLLATDMITRRSLVERAVGEGLRRLEQSITTRGQNLRKRVGSVCLDLEQQRVSELLMQWLELESRREQAFVVAERESDHTLAIGELTLRLRPDRVDRLADGRLLVVDYKTGGVGRSRWLGERPADPQLPIYALLNSDVEGIAFARLKPDVNGKLAFVWVGEELGLNPGGRSKDDLASQVKNLGADVSDWLGLRRVWAERLEALAEEYVRGVATITPQKGVCTFCELSSVCRIDTSRAGEYNDGSGDAEEDWS